MRFGWFLVVGALAVSACGSSSESTGTTLTESTVAVAKCEPTADAVCRGADLAGADLSGVSLVGIDLRQANLNGANLSGADLTQSILIGADLTGANLDGARLVRATADEANFSGATVRGAIFSASSLRGARFDNVDTSVAMATGAVTQDATPADTVAGFLDDDVETSGAGEAVGEVSLTAAAVTPLLEELTFRISRDRVAPTKAARRYAYVALAMFAAAVPQDPLIASLNDLDAMPEPSIDVHPAIAAVVAGGVVARTLFTIPADDVTLAEVTDGLVSDMATTLSAAQLRSTYVFARDVAGIITARADRDGFAESLKMKPPEADEAGEWVPTSPNFQPPIDPGWGTVMPYFDSTNECVLPAPPGGANASSPYQESADEVANVAAQLTDDQKAMARFWDDGRGRTGTPSGHWLVIALTQASERNLAFDEALRIVAHTMMTTSDAFIAVWREKYKWMVERPVTVIQRSNPDWSPYLVTPAFPEYPSGHSATSRAAADVLTSYFGDVTFDDPGYGVTEQSRRQFNVTGRSFASFRAAADEASDSRLYGGIHFRFGLDGGKTLGACIAAGATAKP